MPNWCNNTVEIYHEDPVMLERVRKGFNAGALLNEFIPVPEELQITAGRLGDPVENAKIIAAEESNRAKHGYSNWYDFCVNEWGTKWDIGGDGAEALDIDGGLSFSFDSAWSPPLAAYEKLMDLGFRIYAMYHESGMCFAGIWDNGDDDYYEYSDMNSQEVSDTLPTELDEAFCISENMAEWECDNEENNDEE
jgi:hypothetical protein